MKEKDNDNWLPIDLIHWKDTKFISGKVTTEDEAKSGFACFYLNNAGENHKAYEIDLPKLAYLHDPENNSQELVIVIQVESTDRGEVVRYRNPKGGNGACFLYELKFLSDSEIENIVN